MTKSYDYIITGGGASGLLTAYRMAMDSYFDKTTILIIDQEQKNSNDRTWCFWEKDAGEWDDILETSWNEVTFKSDLYTDDLSIAPYTYKMIRSAKFYQKILDKLSNHKLINFEYGEVLSIKEVDTHVEVVTQSKTFLAKNVLNSIVFDKQFIKQQKFPALQQHFIGWFVETEENMFDANKATFMDFKIPQRNQTRFMYVLPLTPKVALFEYTLFSATLLDDEEYEEGIRTYLHENGVHNYTIIEKEKGNIPMTSYPFWSQNTKRILHIGTAGGWSKASTGFTFMNISKRTKALVQDMKSNPSFKYHHKKNRFWFYDLILLEVLSSYNGKGSLVFGKLFKKNKVQNILQFLDEETSFWQELRIMASMTSMAFIKAFIKRVFN